MLVNDTAHDIISTRISWQPNALKIARKKRMQLAWSVWFVAAIFTLFQFFLQLSSGVMIGELMKSFTLTAFSGGILASSYYYIYMLLQTPAGMLMDRYGPRNILSVSALVVCAGGFIFAIAHSFAIALLGRVFMGGGSAFAFVGCLNVIAIWFPKRRFALMAAIVESAGMLGAITGNFWLAHSIQKIGWRDCMMMAGLFAGILSPCLFLIIRNRPKRRKFFISKISLMTLCDAFLSLIQNPIAWVNGIYCGFMFSVVTVFIALWAIPFFEMSHHIDGVKASITVSTLYIGVALGGPVIGWLDGKTQWRRCLMIGNAFCAAIFLLIVIFCSQLSLSMISILLFFAGLCVGSEVLSFAVANEIASIGNCAASIGFMNMICIMLALILQPFIGFLITNYHFQYAVSIMPVLLMVAGLIGFFLPKRQERMSSDARTIPLTYENANNLKKRAMM